jgi:hypothetical protein
MNSILFPLSGCKEYVRAREHTNPTILIFPFH